MQSIKWWRLHCLWLQYSPPVLPEGNLKIKYKQTNKTYLQKVCIYHLHEKLPKSKFEAKFPVGCKSSVGSILKGMPLIFHANITESVYPVSLCEFDSQGFTTGDNSWLNRIGPEQSKQSKCHFFKAANIQISL